MLPKSTLEKLQGFKLPGFTDALLAQMESPSYVDLTFEERLTLLVDSEYTRRIDVRTKRLLRQACLPNSATIEEVDFSIERGLKKRLLLELTHANWLSTGTNVVITGPTGTGKSFLASVLAQSIVLRGSSVRFQRTNLWLADLQGYAERKRLQQALAGFKKSPLLILDEWLLDPVSQLDARLLLELFESRYNRFSCMFISQFPVASWYARFEDSTLADAILDRLLHNSVRLELKGESMRKLKTKIPEELREEHVAALR